MANTRRGLFVLFLVLTSAVANPGCGDTTPPPAPSSPPPVPPGTVDPGPPTAVPPAKK